MVPDDNATETEGVTIGLTVIAIPPEVAVDELTQIAFDVITQVMISPFDNEDVVNVILFVPALEPFIIH